MLHYAAQGVIREGCTQISRARCRVFHSLAFPGARSFFIERAVSSALPAGAARARRRRPPPRRSQARRCIWPRSTTPLRLRRVRPPAARCNFRGYRMSGRCGFARARGRFALEFATLGVGASDDTSGRTRSICSSASTIWSATRSALTSLNVAVTPRRRPRSRSGSARALRTAAVHALERCPSDGRGARQSDRRRPVLVHRHAPASTAATFVCGAM